MITFRPVTMPRSGPFWNQCLLACVASLLGAELSHFAGAIPDEGWFEKLCDACEPFGVAPRCFYEHDEREQKLAPAGYAIACGPSWPDPTDYHACVAYDGQIVHDPDSGRLGLRSVEWWIVLVPLLKRERKLKPDSELVEDTRRQLRELRQRGRTYAAIDAVTGYTGEDGG